jgi:hypothetical protein
MNLALLTQKPESSRPKSVLTGIKLTAKWFVDGFCVATKLIISKMDEILAMKFAQHSDLRRDLIETDDAILIEVSEEFPITHF